MYCNEGPRGKHRGFWLIDEASYYAKQGRFPADAELREDEVGFLNRGKSAPRSK